MKNAIDWIKSNPLITVAAAIFVLGVVLIVYSKVMAAPAFQAEKSDVLKKEINAQTSLMDVPVPLPNTDPNAEPNVYRVVINQPVIDKVSNIYTRIRDQYDSILTSTVSKNAERHRSVMLGNGQIWPDADPTSNFSLYISAAKDYAAHFKAVFDYENANAWNMPSMVGGSPPPDEAVQGLLDKATFSFVSSIGVDSVAQLSEPQARQLYTELRMELMKLLTDRARSIHLYVTLPDDQNLFAQIDAALVGADAATPRAAPTPAIFGGGLIATPQAGTETSGYPFQIAPWALTDAQPTPDQLWEGQVQLWIIRDIMLAIQRTNNVGGTVQVLMDDGQVVEEPASVINSPIKRLLKLHVVPGYVGLHGVGGALDQNATFSPSGFAGGADFDSGLGAGGGAATGTATTSIYPMPPVSLKHADPTSPAPEHFGITPTGRVSNSVYDVRQVQLQIDIEWKELPYFIETLGEINFMSVLSVDIENIDEYKLLKEGYVYSGKDVVRANLLVETLWFRGWTSPFMPKIVKERLLMLDTPQPQQPQFSDDF